MAGRVKQPVSYRRQADERRLSPAKPLAETGGSRTVKSCGSGTSTLVPSLLEAKSAQPGAEQPSIQKATVARKPDHREEHEAAVKPLRAERRVFWCICDDYARLFVFWA
jgi:hypothetical protein